MLKTIGDDVTFDRDDGQSVLHTSILLGFLAQSSVILASKISNRNDKRLYFYSQCWIIKLSPDLVRFL